MAEDARKDMDKGPQPLEKILLERGLKPHALVEKSTEQLTHKMVAKGCKGRRLTLNVQMKILNALNAVQSEKVYELKDLFNYRGME